jgi:hypothetical protein
MDSQAVHLDSVALAEHCETMLTRLYGKAQVSVSDITLKAILDRVLHNSSSLYPLLSAIRIENSGLNFDELNINLRLYTEAEVKAAFHYLMTEFMFIIGKLTGEQLTPLLHKEIMNGTGPINKKEER